MNIEVDKASSEEGGDIVNRRVEAECGLDGAAYCAVGRIECPRHNGAIFANSTRMELSLSEAFDVADIEIASRI